MNVSPLDLRQQRFHSRFRGFDRIEVTSFLAAVAEDYEQALRETDHLRQELSSMEAVLNEHREHEQNLRATLTTAQRLSDDLKSSAEKEAERIVREAETYANGVVPVARGDAAKAGQEALAYNTQIVNAAVGDAARFSGLAQEYAKAPLETSTRLYLETIDEVLPKMNKTIVGADPKTVDLQFVGKK